MKKLRVFGHTEVTVSVAIEVGECSAMPSGSADWWVSSYDAGEEVRRGAAARSNR